MSCHASLAWTIYEYLLRCPFSRPAKRREGSGLYFVIQQFLHARAKRLILGQALGHRPDAPTDPGIPHSEPFSNGLEVHPRPSASGVDGDLPGLTRPARGPSQFPYPDPVSCRHPIHHLLHGRSARLTLHDRNLPVGRASNLPLHLLDEVLVPRYS